MAKKGYRRGSKKGLWGERGRLYRRNGTRGRGGWEGKNLEGARSKMVSVSRTPVM